MESNNVLTKTTYGAFSSKADKNDTLVYTNDGKNVSAVYAEKANASSITLSKVAVESVKRDATNKDKLVELTVVNGTEKKTYTAGEKITLSKTKLYSASTSKNAVTTKTGTFYIYSSEIVNGRIRITNSAKNVGKTPASNYVTGWIEV